MASGTNSTRPGEPRHLENTEDDAASDIAAALAKLNESSQKMGAAMYAAGQADASAAGGTTGTGDTEEDVVDAEIVDEDTDGSDETGGGNK